MNVTHEDADACESGGPEENTPVLPTVTITPREIPYVGESFTPVMRESIKRIEGNHSEERHTPVSQRWSRQP